MPSRRAELSGTVPSPSAEQSYTNSPFSTRAPTSVYLIAGVNQIDARIARRLLRQLFQNAAGGGQPLDHRARIVRRPGRGVVDVRALDLRRRGHQFVQPGEGAEDITGKLRVRTAIQLL
ncbi:MAG TPA: hypothetical protein VNV86_11845 [Candidatus Acidoferrum sp.]|nr:hypothetical protein [Candidatus Acidoferrum sp.]